MDISINHMLLYYNNPHKNMQEGPNSTPNPPQQWTIYQGLISKQVNLSPITPQKLIKPSEIYLQAHNDAKNNALKYRFPLKYLGEGYKDIVVPCTPAYQLSTTVNTTEREILADYLFFAKVPHQADCIGIASGKRSAIYKAPDGKLIRFKGCGNLEQGFPRQKNQSRGHHFLHTAKRQLYTTTQLNQIFKTHLNLDPPANRPLYTFDYPSPEIARLGLKNDLEMISKYCAVFETQGDRRAGTHLISPLEILFLGLVDHSKTGWKEVFHKKGRVEQNGDLIELVTNFQLFVEPGSKFLPTYDSSKEIENYILLSDTKIQLVSNWQELINKITTKLSPQKYQQNVQQLLSKIKPQNFINICQTILSRIGYQMGQIKRTMCQHEISWGFYLDHGLQWHCNAHLNNFIVTPPKSKAHSTNYFLLPLDYDLAYSAKQFICIDLDSPDYGKNSPDIFQNYLCGEYSAMQMSLFGLEMMNFKYGIDTESEQVTVSEERKMSKIAFRDTLVSAFNAGMRNKGQFRERMMEKWEQYVEEIGVLVEACLYLSMDFQT